MTYESGFIIDTIYCRNCELIWKEGDYSKSSEVRSLKEDLIEIAEKRHKELTVKPGSKAQNARRCGLPDIVISYSHTIRKVNE